MHNDNIRHSIPGSISKNELLSADEEVSLVIRAQNGDELSMQLLIVANH